MSCTKCLASLHVAYVTHGVDPVLLAETLNEVIKCYQDHYVEKEENFDLLEKVHYKSKVNNMMILLNLLQRSKTFG
jgi:hypothetical protein